MMESTRTTKGAGQRETGQSSRLTQNSSNQPNGRPGGSAPQGTSPNRRVSWLRWLIFIIVINLFFYAPLLFGSSSGQSSINLSYTSFLQQVQHGNVKDVTLSGNAVSGDFKTPLHQQQSGSGNGTAAYSQFTSFVPETGDPNLLPSLEKNGVSVTAQPVQIPWWQTALTILLNALPILLLVYFGYMALRGLRQSQQGGGIFGVGRSRAKLYNEERPSTTFADVAGADEAKADLREEIDFLRIHTRTVPLAPDVNLADLARVTPGFSGADLENLVNEAALAAARRESRQVSRQDFENALDKLLLGGKREALMDERERRIVAYHEGGHALVAAVLPDVDPVYKVTIVPRGRSLGVTQFRPEDDRRNVPRTYLVERLAVALGGRSAEELALGDITTGAQNDLKEASQLARRMVSEWGMGEQTGPVVYDLSDGSPYLSQQPLEDHQRVYSEVTAERLDAEVERLITQAHQQARSVLTEHRDALDRLAQALLQEEILEREQVLAIMNGAQIIPGGAR